MMRNGSAVCGGMRGVKIWVIFSLRGKNLWIEILILNFNCPWFIGGVVTP